MRRSLHAWPWLMVVAALSGAALAREPGPHVHGAAKLQVALEKNSVTIDFESPLHNLLGFEHAPRTDAEKAAVAALRERLQKPLALFVPTPAAECSVASVKLDSPVFGTSPAGEGGHADLDAEFVYTCRQPEHLQDLRVTIFTIFPGTRTIDAQVAGPRGQAAARLSAAQPRLAWQP